MKSRSPHGPPVPQPRWPHIAGSEPWPAGPTGRSLVRRPRWLLGAVLTALAVGVIVTILDFSQFLPTKPESNLLNAVAAFALSVALAAVVLRFAGRSRPVWALVLLAQVLSSLAVVVVELVDVIGGTGRVPGWTYTLHLLAHPVQILALLLLVKRRAQGDRAAWLDAALLALTTYALVRGLLLDLPPNPRAGPLAALLGPFPTVAGIAVVAVMVRILLTVRDVTLLLLLAAAIASAAADVGNNIAARTVPFHHNGWVDAVWMAGYALTLAAALHPRASRICNEQPPDAGGLGTLRIVALAIGALLIPSLLVLAITMEWTTKFTAWAWMSVAAMAIVLVRLWLVVQALQTQTRYLAVQARTDALTGLANRRSTLR